MGDAIAMSSPTLAPLAPFGVVAHFAPGTRLHEIDPVLLSDWVDAHRVVVLRGVDAPSRAELVGAARRLGPLQPWSFGAIHEIQPKPRPDNYLYSRHAVPLHWDGAFAGRAPRLLFFHCLASAEEAGGETVFVDTTRVLDRTSADTRELYGQLSFTYETDHVAHYGGKFTAPLVDVHPRTHHAVLRFAEPVVDVNPVRVRAEGLDPIASANQIAALRKALAADDATLCHAWKAGDLLVADNHALLHGRRALEGAPDGTRHLRRINVLDEPKRTWRDDVRDSVRIRRPEFMVAEIPIFFVAALVSGLTGSTLASFRFAELFALFFLLFHFGDMANCLADRDLDAIYKTRLAEAVRGLGVRRVTTQIVMTAALAIALAVDLTLATGRPLILGLVLLGLFLGHQYSFGPLRFKTRGVLQILALVLLIFVGPMWLVAEVLGAGHTNLDLFFAYGAMQQGTILINTAEDMPEDREAGIHTSAIQLGMRSTLLAALVLVVVGGAAVGLRLGMPLHAAGRLVALLPFVVGWGWVAGDIAACFRALRGADEATSLAHVRKAARRMPIWITVTAWGALVAAWAGAR